MSRVACILLGAFLSISALAQAEGNSTALPSPETNSTTAQVSPPPALPEPPPKPSPPDKFLGLNYLEVVIVLILLIMAVPDVCRRAKRPALAYSVFVLFGITLGNLIPDEKVKAMLVEAGRIGFLLLLFEVGLEIQLPSLREFVAPLKKAARWKAWQYPAIILMTAGVFTYTALPHADWGEFTAADWGEKIQWIAVAVLAASALTGCSVGMAHAAWHGYPGLDSEQRKKLLHVMVALEMITILVLAVTKEIYKAGLSSKVALVLGGMVLVVALVTVAAKPITRLFQFIIDRATHWRVHWIVLLVLVVSAVGQRLGLSGEKTAFVLGLCMSRTHTGGVDLEHYIAPISQRLLIPVFFIALGMQLEWRLLFSELALFALAAAFLLMAFRSRFNKGKPKDRTFLLLCPNLTLVALAANVLLEGASAGNPLLAQTTPQLATWLVLTGLFITVPAIFRLPPETEDSHEDAPAMT